MGLLNNILNIQSVTGNSLEMRTFILAELDKIPGVKSKMDGYGNITAVKGAPPGPLDHYPAFACHTDTVHDIRKQYTVLRSKAHNWFAMTIGKDGKPAPTGIGGDDKCGIYICLKLLKTLPVLKCVFFADEEGGCIGADKFDMAFFESCRWVIECDRRGNSDIITKGLGTEMCSKPFLDRLLDIGAKYGYSETPGAWTDVTHLKAERDLRISAVNISVGYYNPHSINEYIVEKDLMKAFEFCKEVALEMVTKSYHYRTIRPAPQQKKESQTMTQSTTMNTARLLGDGRGRTCTFLACASPLEWDDILLCKVCDADLQKGTRKCVYCQLILVTKTEYAEMSCKKCDETSDITSVRFRPSQVPTFH